MESRGRCSELRVVLTNRCNYRCLFCHREGHNDVPHSTISPHLWETLCKALDSGISDVTFTGGEPLLQKEALLSYIRGINSGACSRPHKITIVTNGSLMDEPFMSALSAHGNVTLNISIHSFDPAKYESITGQTRFALREVLSLLELAKRHGVAFKLNCVLLRNVNNSLQDILSAIETSRQAGARSIKFIELLVPNNQDHLIPYFYELDSVAHMLKDELQLVQEDDRKATYRWRSKDGFLVELARCTCAVGCAKCTRYRPLQVNCSNEYQPCFVSIEKVLLDGVSDLEGPLTEGDRKLAEFSRRFGEESPILHNRLQFTGKVFSVFCESDENLYSILTENCNAHGLEKVRFVDQEFTVYLPRTADKPWLEFRKVARVRRNNFNLEREVLIVSDNDYGKQGKLFFGQTRFAKPNDFFMEGTPEQIRRLMEGLDFKAAIVYTRKGYQLMDMEKRGVRHEISRLETAGASKIVYSCSCNDERHLADAARLIGQFRLKVISEPFLSYVRALGQALPAGGPSPDEAPC